MYRNLERAMGAESTEEAKPVSKKNKRFTMNLKKPGHSSGLLFLQTNLKT